jgi:cystathionine beta-lyase
MFDFDSPIDRRDSDSIKWRKFEGKDIIPLWVADMDFTSPPAVIEALLRRVSHGVFGYAMPDKQLAETICEHLEKKYHWHVSPYWIVWLPGLVCGLNVACRSVDGPEVSVITTIPAYPPFLIAPRNANQRLVTSPMVQGDHRWQIDLDHLSQAITKDSAMFILCNPQNPTGRVFEHHELMALAEICQSNDLIICSDEIHCDLILEPKCSHIPIASMDEDIARRTITLMAPSKTYNIPGLGCAFAVISNDHLRRRFTQAMAGIVPHVNLMGLVAAQAAFRHGEAWLDALLDYLRENRDLVYTAVNQIPGLHMGLVEGTYLAWIDVHQVGIEQPARFFENYGLGLSDGKDFDGPGFVRLNFGCSRQVLQKALDRLTIAIRDI